MSKKVIIFHGTDCKPTDYWYPWLGKLLEADGHSVDIPSYPEINHESITIFLPKILQSHTFDEDTIIIGHSAGGPLLLSILENIETVIPKAIMVAGYSYRIPGEEKDPILQDSYNWDKIKSSVKDLIFINSDNDPWGCDDKQGRFMFDKLGGSLVIRHDGHFGSTTFKQPYPEFDLLLRLVK